MVSKTSLLPVKCNYCDSLKQKVIYASGAYPLVSCLNCGLSFLSPRPDPDIIDKLYNQAYFNQNQASVGYTSYDLLYNDLIKEARQRLTLIKSFITHGKLLDAGCAFGDFLVQARKENFTVIGCDINKQVVAFVRKKHHLTAQVGDIAKGKLPRGPFDVITAWDVIEHMVDPKKSLAAFFNIQKKGGYLFMTTPNIDSLDAKTLGKHWYGFKRIPEHLYFFSPRSISALLQVVGYDTVAVKPWGFQRNLAYCIQQIARYNSLISRCLQPLIRLLHLDKISLFFPVIDMMVVAQKPKA